jgi:hypothetical protein
VEINFDSNLHWKRFSVAGARAEFPTTDCREGVVIEILSCGLENLEFLRFSVSIHD